MINQQRYFDTGMGLLYGVLIIGAYHQSAYFALFTGVGILSLWFLCDFYLGRTK
jgi:hypothetical protein